MSKRTSEVSSVEQLRIECNEAEQNFPRREIRPIPSPNRSARQISEIYADLPTEMSMNLIIKKRLLPLA